MFTKQTLNQSAVSEEEIKRLYQKFKELDVDGSGTLEPNEFFDVPGKLTFWNGIKNWIELSQNPLVQRVIDVFDKNKDGKISFTEFVSGLSSLHSDGPLEDKIKFVFSIYDMDGDGFISNGELFKVSDLLFLAAAKHLFYNRY